MEEGLHSSGSRFTFGTHEWQKNFDFAQTKENEDLLQEINQIYLKSQSQSNLSNLKEQYKSNGSLNFTKENFIKKLPNLSEIMEERLDEQFEVDEEFLHQEQALIKGGEANADVFTLGNQKFDQSEEESSSGETQEPFQNVFPKKKEYHSDVKHKE